MRTRVKICGITRTEDALSAAAAGADALGFIFWPPSGRYIDPAQVPRVLEGVPPMLSSIGVVVDPSRDEMTQILHASRVDVIQFHGAEAREFCESFERPYIKSVRVRSAADIDAAANAHPHAAALLLDTYRKGLPGGTGAAFDWHLVPHALHQPVILAGGLSIENVRQAIAAVNPFAVDVSGGVEIEPGIKDPAKIFEFVKEVNGAGTSK